MSKSLDQIWQEMQIAKLEKDRQERLIWEQRERSRLEYLKKNEIFERNQSILKNDVNFTTGKINTTLLDTYVESDYVDPDYME
jgi:hypothetical protein